LGDWAPGLGDWAPGLGVHEHITGVYAQTVTQERATSDRAGLNP